VAGSQRRRWPRSRRLPARESRRPW
jgi:hypothetical protein